MITIDTTVGLDPTFVPEEESVMVWPNPAGDVLKIAINNATEQATVTIYDQTGKAVYKKENTLLNTRCDIRTLTEGVYYLMVSNNNLQQTVKVVKM